MSKIKEIFAVTKLILQETFAGYFVKYPAKKKKTSNLTF